MKKKKKWIIILAVAAAVLIFCAVVLYDTAMTDYAGVYPGMSAYEMVAAVPQDNAYLYQGYYFYTNKWGNPIVARFSQDTKVVVELISYPALAIRTSERAFDRIKPGMTLHEVIAIVGIPNAPRASDASALAYKDKSGNIYHIYLEDRSVFEEFQELYVTAVQKLSEE